MSNIDGYEEHNPNHYIQPDSDIWPEEHTQSTLQDKASVAKANPSVYRYPRLGYIFKSCFPYWCLACDSGFYTLDNPFPHTHVVCPLCGSIDWVRGNEPVIGDIVPEEKYKSLVGVIYSSYGELWCCFCNHRLSRHNAMGCTVIHNHECSCKLSVPMSEMDKKAAVITVYKRNCSLLGPIGECRIGHQYPCSICQDYKPYKRCSTCNGTGNVGGFDILEGLMCPECEGLGVIK